MSKNFDAKIRLGAIDNVSSTIEGIRSKFPKLDKAIGRTNFLFENMQKNTAGLRGKLDSMGSAMTNAGKNMTAFATVPIVGAMGLAVKMAADYETALLGVGKTTNLSGKALEQMGDQFQKMSTRIPLSTVELMQLGQTAAQLGVRGTDNILKFSETMAKLATASNVAGEEGATDMARLISVTGGGIGDIDRFAAALVDLGNNSKTTEKDILSFATRLGSSTALFGTSGVQALGMGAALSSVGIEAEAGSSAVQRALGQINKAILKGGAGMGALSKLTGIATGDLKKRFKEDAIGVLTEFTQGVSNIDKQGGDISKVLGSFGLSGVRDIAVLGTMSKKIDDVRASLARSTKAFKENSALDAEFAAQKDSLNNQMVLLKNNLTVFAVQIGTVLMPAVKSLIGVLGPFLQWAVEFAKAHPGIVKVMLALAGVVAVIGPLLLLMGALFTGLSSMITVFTFLSAAGIGFGTVLAGIGTAVGWLVSGFGILLTVLKFVAGIFVAIAALPGWVIVGIVALIAAIWIFRDAIKNGIVAAWDWVIEKIDYVIKKMSSVGGFLKSFLGGGDVNVNTKSIAPAAAPLGGLESSAKMNSEFFTQTNNARVDVMVRAPENTKIKSESQNGALNIQRGLAGAF
jgi:TP901 family phage tail tape measure protein